MSGKPAQGLARARLPGRLATSALVLATFGLAAASPGQAAPAIDVFYQRAQMTAADGDCRLFSPGVAAALAAAKAQARGAALRGGASVAELAGIEARADAAAGAAGCRSSALAAAAQRVRDAFVSYTRLDRLEFPGDFAAWTAERAADGPANGWRVFQHARFGWDAMTFGIAAHGPARPLMAVASFADGARPYGARLVIRDAQVTDGPYLDAREADLAGRLPLDARLPPPGARRVFAAEAMSPAGDDLRGHDQPRAWAFRFPAPAADALAGLDPREAARVEFLFAGEGGEATRAAYVEVGDFAAARAFEALPRP